MSIAIGYINTVNNQDGTATVIYPDKDDKITPEFPIFSFAGQGQTMQQGDMVLVLHLTDDISGGVILGRFGETGAGAEVINGSLQLKDSRGSISLDRIIAKCEED